VPFVVLGWNFIDAKNFCFGLKGSAIEKLKLSEMTCREGIIAVAKIIYEVHDEAKDKAFELELSWVCDESNKQHQRVPADLLEEAKAAAKAAKDALDEDEGMDAD
jgi:20S proteasome subunit alpha 7